MRKAISSLQIPFSNKTHRRNSVFVGALPSEENATRILSFMLAILVFAYISFVSFSIVNVIARKEANDQATALRSVVGTLERDYFALSETVGAANGDSLGLAPVSDTQYIHRPGTVGAALGVRNEI